MWKSTSSNGWEYLIVWEDLGSRLLCKPFMCYLIVIILIMRMIMLSDNKTLEL